MRTAVLVAFLVLVPVLAARGSVPETVIELPGPELLPTGAQEIDFLALARRTGPGVFSNLSRAISGAQEARWRHGLSSGCEISLAASFNEQNATPVSGDLTPTSAGMPVLGGGVRFRLPDRILGWRVVFGTGASLVNGRDRERFLPDDYTRFNPTYVAASRMLSEDLRGELVFKRNRVLSNAQADGTNFTTFDAAFEFFATEDLSFQLEVLSQRLSMRTIGDYGTSVGTDGVSANVGVRFGDVQFYARGVNRSEDLEAGVRVGCRL